LAGAEPPPLEAYGHLPSMDNVAISPNGKMLAYETTVDSVPAVLVVSIDERKIVSAMTVKDQKIRDISWADDDHVLTTVSTTHFAIGVYASKTEWFLCMSLNVHTGRQVLLLGQGPEDTMNIILDGPFPRTVDGRTLVYVTGIAFHGGGPG